MCCKTMQCEHRETTPRTSSVFCTLQDDARRAFLYKQVVFHFHFHVLVGVLMSRWIFFRCLLHHRIPAEHLGPWALISQNFRPICSPSPSGFVSGPTEPHSEPHYPHWLTDTPPPLFGAPSASKRRFDPGRIQQLFTSGGTWSGY